jgi:hypothetical protein
MLDETTMGEMPADDLALQALLYASGELDESDAERFEQRLGEDQAAREALLQAVTMSQLASGQPPPAPDPEYRDRVRQRLRQRRRLLRTLTRTGSNFGPPALWAVLGAIAAVLMMVVLGHLVTTHRDTQPTNRTAPTIKQSTPSEISGPPAPLSRTLGLLPGLHDEPRRRELEAGLHQAEDRITALLAQLRQPIDSQTRAKLEADLLVQARAVIALDVQVLQLWKQQLAKELTERTQQLDMLQADPDKAATELQRSLLESAKRR